MLALVPWLLERPGASVDEAADAFGVSPAAIRQDLYHLDFCGLPGLGGGDLFEVDLVGDRIVVSMADELKRPLRPTATEALRLVLTVDAVAEVLGDEVPALASALAKVRRALGISDQVADVLADEPLAVLATVRDAVRQQLRLAVEYQGRGDRAPRNREVEPWQLHVVDGMWYLHAFDVARDEPRVFRVDRIHAALLLDEPVTRAMPTILPEPVYQPSADALVVEIDVEAAAEWLFDVLAIEQVIADDGETKRVRLSTDAPDWLADVVISAGGAARVVSPDMLRAQIHARARQGLAVVERILTVPRP